MPARLLLGLEEVRRHWGWYLVLGFALMVLGVVALSFAVFTTLVSVLIFGWLLLISGILQSALAFQVRSWSGFFLHLLAGLLEVVVGMLVVAAPLEAAAGLTLLLALYLLVGGLFRLFAAFSLGFPNWGWVAFGGLVSFLLGLALWRQWPISGLFFIGICVGIDLVMHGAAWIAFALAARRLPTTPLEPRVNVQ